MRETTPIPFHSPSLGEARLEAAAGELASVPQGTFGDNRMMTPCRLWDPDLSDGMWVVETAQR